MAELKSKSPFDFVPDLLAAMSSPIVFLSLPIFDASGRLTGFCQAFGKEGMNEVRPFEVDTMFSEQDIAVGPPRMPARQKIVTMELLARDESKPFGTWNT